MQLQKLHDMCNKMPVQQIIGLIDDDRITWPDDLEGHISDERKTYIQHVLDSRPNPREQADWKALEPQLRKQLLELTDQELNILYQNVEQYIARWQRVLPPENHVSEAESYQQGIREEVIRRNGIAEREEWERLDKTDWDALLAYLNAHPQSAYASEIDDYLWAEVDAPGNPNVVNSVQQYIDAFPNGKHVVESDNLKREYVEWIQTKSGRDIFAIRDYIDQHPGGRYYNDAMELFMSLKEIESNEVFLGSSDIWSDDAVKKRWSKLYRIPPAGRSVKSSRSYISGIWRRLFKKNTQDEVFSSIFASAEVKRNSHLMVQVYLHLYEETERVYALAQESDKNAERRDYIPLQCKLKKGDKVDVLLNIYGESLLKSDKKSVIWQGSFTKCGFDYFVPKDIDVDELSCTALLTVNDIPIGEMRFITKIVESPRLLNPEIIAHKYNKVFISYAHKDEAKVKSFHEGLKLAGIEHFFDRDYLEIGNIFPQVIQDYINSADLFVLFWSENASKSEYVEKERTLALKLAFPQIKPQQAAKLSIYPMSIEPRAELPDDMKDIYHFGII